MIELPLDGGFYESEALPLSAQQAINCYVNIPQTSGALSAAALFGSSGLSELATTGDTPDNVNRGAHVKAGKPYFVNGQSIYRLDRSFDINGLEVFTPVLLGAITGTGRVSMADNGKQLIVLADGKGWIVDESAIPVFQQITDLDFTANGIPEKVTYIDSFFVCSTDAKKIIKSAANNGLSWNALDFEAAEADPDPIRSVISYKNQLYVAGEETFEVFQNAGLSGFPFQRINGLVIDKGLSASNALAITSLGIVFVGAGVNESPAIWVIAGGQAQKLSTTAIDSVLSQMSPDEIESAFILTYGTSGAYFVSVVFASRVFEYNLISQKWNERSSRIINPKGLTENVRWRVNSAVTAFNRVICGDSLSGKIGELSRSFYTEYDLPIVRTFVSSPLANQNKAIFISSLELTMEAGITNTEPQIRLSISKDGGYTYNSEIWRSFGKSGEYFRRAIWRRLGRFPRYAVLKFEMSDNVKFAAIKLTAQVKSGN